MPLSRWLLRPGRVVDPKESVWIFCEVLLLLEGLQRGMRSGASLPRGIVRPSKLLLHSDGRISFAPSALPGAANGGDAEAITAATVAASSEEDALYCSPEEAATPMASPAAGPSGVLGASNPAHAAAEAAAADKALVFSLGMLFFELFHAPGAAAAPANGNAPTGAGTSAAGADAAAAAAATAAATAAEQVASARRRALSDLRQRILPPSFLRHRPQEAALTLALLHPDPAARPAVSELAGGELLGGYCEALRARHRQMAAAAAAEQVGCCVGVWLWGRCETQAVAPPLFKQWQ